MKVHLKLNKMKYEGFLILIKNCLNAITRTDLKSVQYRDALFDLQTKLQGRYWNIKEKNNITLTDMEVLALSDMLGTLAADFPPYDKALAYHILTEIDFQKERHVCLLLSNLSRKMNNGQLGIE